MATVGIQMAGWKPEVEITFERKEMATRFQRLPIFSTIPDSDMPMTTWPDVGRHGKRTMSMMQTGSRNNFEWKNDGNAISAAYPHIFDYAGLRYATDEWPDVGRHGITQNGR